ncbi:MAG: C39 family peptidase [Thermodesulfobacteriota bacterium]
MNAMGKTAVLAVLLALVGGLYASTADAGDRYQTIDAKLRHETPRWHQLQKDNGDPVGCGPTAWAIVYGYWKQHKGKTRLLEGVSGANDPDLKAAMEEIARYTKSTYGVYQGTKWGRTMPRNMCRGKKYAEKRGYRVSCERIRGTEFDKFDRVKEWIRADKPVIILTNDPSHAFSTLHYPVIEQAQKKQKRVLRKWRDRDVNYFVNMGDGSDDWIWVREVGRNHHPHTGSFSMFLIDIH